MGTVLGAVSYRRTARQLSRTLAPAVSAPPRPQAPPEPALPLKATDVMSRHEIVTLFVLPGVIASGAVAGLAGLCRWALEVETVEDAVRQLRWLSGSGPK